MTLDATQQLIGSVLRDPQMLDDVVARIRVEDMPTAADQELWRAIVRLYSASRAVDCVTILHDLERNGVLSVVGEDTIFAAYQAVPHGKNALSYADIVKDSSIKRQIGLQGRAMVALSESPETSGVLALSQATDQVFRLSESNLTSSMLDVRTDTGGVLDAIEKRRESGILLPGMSTGLIDLDLITGGFQNAHNIVLAGRPAMGKTSLALQILHHVAFNLNHGVLFLSLEMSFREVVAKILALSTGIPTKRVTEARHLTDQQIALLREHERMFTRKKSPILIEDDPSLNMTAISAMARKHKRLDDVRLIVMDYLQLVSPTEAKDSRTEQVSKISRNVKILAKSLDVPVLALSQLNRAVEGREGHRPIISDLKESGSIEQDADIVLLIHRPDYYNAEDLPGFTEIIIGKNRHGPTGGVFTAFKKTIGRFENLHIMGEAVAF